MKHLLILSVAFASLAAVATPRQNPDALIRFTNQPRVSHSTLNTTVTFVSRNGLVVQQVLDSNTGEELSQTTVKKLPLAKVQEFTQLIEEARYGKIETVHNKVHCLAMSPYQYTYDADNGNVFLRSGALCMDSTVNTSPSAVKLVGELSTIMKEIGRVNDLSVSKITELHCTNNPPMGDAGYNVNIYVSKNGMFSHLGEESFMGENTLGNFPVVRRLAMDRTFYMDENSLGRVFRMSVDTRSPLANGQYNASFTAETLQGPVQGNLICSFTR